MISQQKPIRILHVVGGMNRGGVETWLMSVLRGIDRSRFQMDFLVHTNQECAYDSEIRELGSRVIPCMHPSKLVHYTKNFRSILREFGPYDVVHSHVYWFSGFLMWMAAKEGIPRRIAHIYPHEDLKRQGVGRTLYRQFMAALITKYATGLLTDSEVALQAFTRGRNLKRISYEVIYPVVDLSPFTDVVDREKIRRRYDLPCDLPLVIYVARFFPHKNHKGLLEIADIVNSGEIRAHFVMVGSHGPLLDELRSMTAAREDVSMIVGPENVAEILLASDLFVFPSSNEGFGIVALEAQAAGLPVVATNLPSLCEVLSPGLRPFMFEPGAWSVAASHILTLLSDTSLRSEVIKGEDLWLKNFSVAASISKLTDFYTTPLYRFRLFDTQGPLE